MSSFDYNAPAELFLAKPAKGCRTKYRRFATAAEAIRYAVEELRTPKAFGAHLEVGDARFSSSDIQRLYEAEDYPLGKPKQATELVPFPPETQEFPTGPPSFKLELKTALARYDLSGLCEALGTLGQRNGCG